VDRARLIHAGDVLVKNRFKSATVQAVGKQQKSLRSRLGESIAGRALLLVEQRTRD
jgi:hypothetical protein